MIIVDQELLREFSEKLACEWCGKKVHSGLDAHHISARGMDGGKRADIPENLVALCRECHTRAHGMNEPSREQLFEIAGNRLGKTGEECQAEVWRIQREKKK